jgi:hypothetical protein
MFLFGLCRGRGLCELGTTHSFPGGLWCGSKSCTRNPVVFFPRLEGALWWGVALEALNPCTFSQGFGRFFRVWDQDTQSGLWSRKSPDSGDFPCSSCWLLSHASSAASGSLAPGIPETPGPMDIWLVGSVVISNSLLPCGPPRLGRPN